MKYIVIALALLASGLVSGCATNHYDLASQPDYRDSLNNAHDRVANSGQKGNN